MTLLMRKLGYRLAMTATDPLFLVPAVIVAGFVLLATYLVPPAIRCDHCVRASAASAPAEWQMDRIREYCRATGGRPFKASANG